MGYSKGGRSARGLVNESIVRRIRQLAAQGSSTRSLADAYGLTPEAVRKIIRWDSWRWVSEEEPPPQATQPEPSAEVIAASLQRVLELTGMKPASAPAVSPEPIPSMEEILKRQYELGAPAAERAQAALSREVGKPDRLLDELMGTGGTKP